MERVTAPISADIEVVLRRYKRLEASETTQGFARKYRLAVIATKSMQPIVAFGA
jgi:hypothetical protein